MISDVICLRSTTIEEKILKSCGSIIAAFFPGKNPSISLSVPASSNQSMIIIEQIMTEISSASSESSKDTGGSFEIKLAQGTEILGQEIIDSYHIDFVGEISLPGKEPFFQILVKRALFLFLERYTKQNIPWGILSGIRPGKLLFRMDELGLPDDVETKILQELYCIANDKIQLLGRIADIQRPFVERIKQNKNLMAIYIGIPFCPSRCFYCSFPSTEVSPMNKSLLTSYLQALQQEVKATGEMMKELSLTADSIYIGGGTPNVLEESQLERLLRVIQDHIPRNSDLEYTVEAGRPDSIDYRKLSIIKQYDVNRLSINPQTMQDQTLKIIGRNHTVTDIIETYNLAREMADWIINMDLIIGLPQEGLEELFDSIEKVLQLNPDNLTIHAMALKRGSKAWENNYHHGSEIDWSKVPAKIELIMTAAGYNPYYLYRQKFMVGNLENVGYAQQRKECRYNMAVIEEKQNLIGLGAGASSKIFNQERGHENLYNPIDIARYIERLEDLHIMRRRALSMT